MLSLFPFIFLAWLKEIHPGLNVVLFVTHLNLVSSTVEEMHHFREKRWVVSGAVFI